jgi:hypothetical protein
LLHGRSFQQFRQLASERPSLRHNSSIPASRTDGFNRDGCFLQPNQFELGGIHRCHELFRLSGRGFFDEHDDNFLFGHESGGQHQLLLHGGCWQQWRYLASNRASLRYDIGWRSFDADGIDGDRSLFHPG